MPFSGPFRYYSIFVLLYKELDKEVTSEEGPNTDFSYFDCYNKRGLHCIHLNARSLLTKIHELRHIFQKTSASRMGITDSWLDSTISDSEVNIPGYIAAWQDINREGGRVCIF